MKVRVKVYTTVKTVRVSTATAVIVVAVIVIARAIAAVPVVTAVVAVVVAAAAAAARVATAPLQTTKVDAVNIPNCVRKMLQGMRKPAAIKHQITNFLETEQTLENSTNILLSDSMTQQNT